MNDFLYKKNILSLSSIDPALSFSLCTVNSSSELEIHISRSGDPVPVLNRNGVSLQMHSLFDPIREGVKLYESSKKEAGFIIIYGLGGGYHIYPYLESKNIENILIIDTDRSFVKKILENTDLTLLFTNPKVNILIDPDDDTLEKTLADNYLPSISGDLGIVQLKNRVRTETLFFEKITEKISSVLEKISADFASQAYFGKRWFKNIIKNLRYAEGKQIIPEHRHRAAIIGAGPSLEEQLRHLKKNSEGTILLSSDTAALFLVDNGIIPDYIISIDCQHITYNHFMDKRLFEIPLIMDLGSPSFLSRLFENRLYFTSANPLSSFIASSWRFFQFVDTFGGNVGYSALSVAASIGISDITMYGIDYSFINFKPYARDTFLYKYFYKKADKLEPVDSSIYSFASSNNLYETEKERVYSSRRMDFYHSSMAALIKSLPVSVKFAPHSPRKINSSRMYKTSSAYNIFSSGSPGVPWDIFLENYMKSLCHLPEPDGPYNKYFGSLTKKEKELWTTIFPVCAALRKDNHVNRGSTSSVMIEARKWCVDQLEKVIAEK